MSGVDRSRPPVPGPDPSFRFPSVAVHRLSNGLEVRTIEHRGLPVLTVLVLVRAGAASDPSDREGLAALTADMLDEGADGRSAPEVQEALARAGSSIDTEVGPDSTSLTLITLTHHAERALDIMAGILTRPDLAGPDLERVRQLRLNRLLQLRDVPAALADRLFLRGVYGAHPYGHLSIGSARGLQSASVGDVTAFHRRWFTPAESVVVAAGDATHAQLARLVEQALGRWQAAPGADSVGGAEPSSPSDPDPAGVVASPGARLLVVDRPGAVQSEVRVGRVAASRDTPDYYALLVLNMALGGQFVSRVNMNLRQRKGYTYGARTGFDCRIGRGPFTLQTSVHSAVTAEAVSEALAEIRAIGWDRPVTSDELVTARAALTRGFPRNFETAEQIARAMAQLVLYRLPDDTLERFVPSVEEVTAEMVTEAARAHLPPGDLSVALVGDASVFGARLDGLGLGEPTLQPIDD